MCINTIFLWQVKHGCLGILKVQVLYPPILLYKDALLFCINIWRYVLKECLTHCLNFLFCFITPSCHSRKKWITKYFLTGSPVSMFYVFFSLRIFSRFHNYLFVEYLWTYFIILFELVALHKSKNGSIDHFIWWFSSLNLICIESL